MSRLLLASLTAVFLILCCLSPKSHQATSTPKPGAIATLPAPTNTVTVTFEGLMVFDRSTKGGYEVGILKPVAKGHEFTVNWGEGKKGRADLPPDTRWILDVENWQDLPGNSQPWERGHKVRRPDDLIGQYDFSWIIDLEGREFHTHPLNLDPGHLSPIIYLPHGVLSTKSKSIDLRRSKGGAGSSKFGFVPEAIALSFDLEVNQALVLKTDGGGIIFRLPYNPVPHPAAEVSISNVRHPLPLSSDFKMYYELFPEVRKKEKFDFSENKDHPVKPLNPGASTYGSLIYRFHKSRSAKDEHPLTCCQMACTAVFLGTSQDALK